MRKLLILLLMAAATVFSLSGCGGGSSGDPLGTDSITLVSAASQIHPNGTVVLTATVKNASGDPVVDRSVAFGFAANSRGIFKESGATAGLSRSAITTNSDGNAIITYTAGPTAGGIDVVSATIDDRSVEVYITVGSGGTFTEYQIATFEQGDKLVTVGIYSILIATVKGMDASGNLAGIPNEPVTFSILHWTGTGTLTDLSVSTNTGPTVTVNTSADGVAKVIFTDNTITGSTMFDARISTGINKQLTISW